MVDLATGVAERIDEVQLRATVGREVLDQQNAAALRKIALDLGVAAEALRLLAHVEHRQAEPFGDPRREGDAGGLATGAAVDRLVAGLALNQRAGEAHELRAGAREGDGLAAGYVDGARPHRREGEGTEIGRAARRERGGREV